MKWKLKHFLYKHQHRFQSKHIIRAIAEGYNQRWVRVPVWLRVPRSSILPLRSHAPAFLCEYFFLGSKVCVPAFLILRRVPVLRSSTEILFRVPKTYARPRVLSFLYTPHNNPPPLSTHVANGNEPEPVYHR